MIDIQTVIHVVMDQSALGIDHGFFDRVKLLGDLKTGFSRLDHLDHGAQVAIGAFQPGDQRGVGCMCMRLYHRTTLTSPGGYNKAEFNRCGKDGQTGRLMQQLRTSGRLMMAALLCLSLTVWSFLPTVSHVPKIAEVLAEHAQTVAEHGHSHGLQDDLPWALHGHSHDADTHDHSPALAVHSERTTLVRVPRDAWHLRPSLSGPHRVFRIERPPRV